MKGGLLMRITAPPLRWLVTLLAVLTLAACSTAPLPPAGGPPPLHPAEREIKPGVKYPIDIYDPFERLNRRLYNFNYYFDKYIFLPVVNGYEYLLPDYVEERISKFFTNIGEVGNLVNNLLQFKFRASGITLGRLLVNSTTGIAGLWDPATAMGLPLQLEDFGQTLGHHGVGHGPYLVLPILGPSNLRDAGGFAVDTGAYSLLGPPVWLDDANTSTTLAAARAIDQRHRQPFRYHASGSPFEYEMVRYFYTKKRELEIAK
jgi:phospholipid-binding lipoprotein MlaA